MISCVGVVRTNCLSGIGQRVVRDERSDVAEFRRVRLEKFLARGNAVKKIGDADRRSRGQARRLHVYEFSAGKFQRACLRLPIRRAFRGAAARPRQSLATLRRENPASKSKANRQRISVCSWRGARKPAARRRESCRGRRRSRGSCACRRLRFRCEWSSRQRPTRFPTALSLPKQDVRQLRPQRFCLRQLPAVSEFGSCATP